jgi:hypothetical protein
MVARKVGAFHDDLVAGGDQGLAKQIQRLLAAGGDDQLSAATSVAPLLPMKAAQLLAQRVVAFGGAVLQRGAGFVVQGLGCWPLSCRPRQTWRCQESRRQS